LGHKSVQEAQKYISSSEFTEWIAYSEIEPFGSIRDDQHFGTVVATIYNVNRGKHKKAIQWNDVFQLYEDRKPKDWQQLLSIVEMLNEAFGGVDLRETPSA